MLDLSITRHYVFGLIAALLVLALFIPVAQRYRKGVGRATAPRGVLQNLAEVFIVFVRDEIARPNIGEKADRFLPYLLTAFFFILFCNLLGLVPNLGAATSNLAVTGVLALFTFIIGTIYASKDHWKHIFWPPGVPVFVKPILIPVEIMGLFTRHAALAIRLFANMTAGTLVILSLIGLIFMINALFGALAAWLSTLPSVLLTLFISAIKLLVASFRRTSLRCFRRFSSECRSPSMPTNTMSTRRKATSRSCMRCRPPMRRGWPSMDNDNQLLLQPATL